MFTLGNDLVIQNFHNKEYAIVATTTYEFVEMAINWYKSLLRIQLAHLALIISYDIESYDRLNNIGIPSAFLDVGHFSRKTDGEWYEMEKRTHHIGIMTILSNFKINIIRSETDIFFFKNFLNKIINEDSPDYDMIVSSDRRYDKYNHKRKKGHIISVEHGKNIVKDWGLSDQAKYGEINGSLCYLPHRTRGRVIKFHNELADPTFLEQFPVAQYAGSAQRIWNQAVKEKGLRVKVLSVFDFANGSLWNVPYLKKIVEEKGYSVHYNFHSKAAPLERFNEKKEAMIKNGHWLL